RPRCRTQVTDCDTLLLSPSTVLPLSTPGSAHASAPALERSPHTHGQWDKVRPPAEVQPVAPLALEDVLGIKFPSAGRWSPNPEPPLLAFTWDDGGIVDLYVTGAGVTGASEPTRITAGRGRAEPFAWAPGGPSLVFVGDRHLPGAC